MNRFTAKRDRLRSMRVRLAESIQTVTALRSGEVDAFVMLKDGRERVYTLQGAENPYRHFVEAMSEGAVTLRRDGTILFCNARLADLLATRRDRLVGSRLQDWLSPEDRPMANPLLAVQQQPYRVDAEVMASGGARIPVRLSASAIGLTDVDAIALLVWDLTEERARIKALEEANIRLQAADRHKDEFLSVISHELRTPLNFVMGFASLLEGELPGALTPQQRRYVASIEEGAQRMLHLVDDLLDAAAFGAGRLELACAEIDYAALLNSCIAGLANFAKDREVTIASDIRVTRSPVLDPQRIGQVVSNLLTNATKFSRPGDRVIVRAFEEGDEIKTEVEDTGIGIAPEDLPGTFERFKQLDMSSTRAVGGIGLGLAISKILIEAHGGQLGAQSAPRQGSLFWFRIPLHACGPKDPSWA